MAEKVQWPPLVIDYQGERLAGVDEVGRGPLVGAVVAAAVILDPDRPIEGLNDSKTLTARRREALDAEVRARALAYCVAEASPLEVDRLNIYHATHLAMRRAIDGLAPAAEYLLVDGNRLPGHHLPGQPVVKGDARHPAPPLAHQGAAFQADDGPPIHYRGFSDYKKFSKKWIDDMAVKYGWEVVDYILGEKAHDPALDYTLAYNIVPAVAYGRKQTGDYGSRFGVEDPVGEYKKHLGRIVAKNIGYEIIKWFGIDTEGDGYTGVAVEAPILPGINKDNTTNTKIASKKGEKTNRGKPKLNTLKEELLVRGIEASWIEFKSSSDAKENCQLYYKSH